MNTTFKRNAKKNTGFAGIFFMKLKKLQSFSASEY